MSESTERQKAHLDTNGLVFWLYERFTIRKHRALKRALRLTLDGDFSVLFGPVRKHRAPKGALRRTGHASASVGAEGQKAPSSKRCIKTNQTRRSRLVRDLPVRKHRAPKGAFRRQQHRIHIVRIRLVRKHRAPKGA